MSRDKSAHRLRSPLGVEQRSWRLGFDGTDAMTNDEMTQVLMKLHTWDWDREWILEVLPNFEPRPRLGLVQIPMSHESRRLNLGSASKGRACFMIRRRTAAGPNFPVPLRAGDPAANRELGERRFFSDFALISTIFHHGPSTLHAYEIPVAPWTCVGLSGRNVGVSLGTPQGGEFQTP